MRDYVEIGIGREARRGYGLREISLVPNRRTRSSKDVDTTWNIDAYSFDIPLASHPTDALATPEFVIEMGKQGGLGVINAEGLWGRHADLEGALEKVYADPEDLSVLQKLHAAELDHELLSERIAQVRDSGCTVAVRVSPQHARDLAPVVIKAGAEILFIQGTLLSAEYVSADGEPLNLKDFIGSLEVPVIAGGVTDYTTALHLMRAGAAGVIVGSGFTTNEVTVGIDTPLATAIADVAAARRDYLDETGGRYVHVIADAAFDFSADIIKAIACGADAVMVGLLLASAEEAGGKGWFWPSVAAHPRFPRGHFEHVAREQQVPLEQVLFGPSTESFGQLNLVGALKRAMAKCGYTNLKAFQKVGLSVQ
ncbi:oxidoreductase [Corynebacterium phocae]|uniref:Oxidoreductase n=1 Tax=Corynebacterium phocae TaxID=161895 RepID=A0A1L7D5A7_9CORY|nr:GuaB3 family IMP dehydrogenase-related protein [Corynebacterium phocae]APT93183.1 oxidoreductase [Corynebacterium phocae]KAA8721918.1 GuaB3 family IMP dehydrogenase-related protein [Corynebacterium phocae]